MKKKSVLEKFATWAAHKKHYTHQDIEKWTQYGHMFAKWIKIQYPDIHWRQIMEADILEFCEIIASWKMADYNRLDAEIGICTIMEYIEYETERRNARNHTK